MATNLASARLRRLLVLSILVGMAGGRLAAQAARAESEDEIEKGRVGAALAARDGRLPSLAQVTKLEQLLAGRPCIGSVQRWTRRFALGLGRNYRLDLNVIEFSFERSPRQKQGRRTIVPFGALIELDDSQFYFASGKYNVGSGKMAALRCGLNHPELPPDWRPPR